MKRFLIGLLALGAALMPGAATPQSFNAQQQAEMRAIVRDYLVNNPDVLKDAIDALNKREADARMRQIVSDHRDYSVGPANAKVVIVEFFDYRCPYCMASLPWIVDTMHRRPDIRWIFKEMPIAALHGPPAVEASRASLAAMPQGRYIDFHRALMAYNGELSPQRIDLIARQVGIDVPTMRRRMGDEAITTHLVDNYTLLANAGEVQTPAFLVNGQWIYGAKF
ncbi:MAG: thioredoxin domain-containing protein, partial [Pseudomonadota bacterium]